jgi:hypothetical protein
MNQCSLPQDVLYMRQMVAIAICTAYAYSEFHLCDAAHRVTASDVRALALLHRSHEAHLFVSDAAWPASTFLDASICAA